MAEIDKDIWLPRLEGGDWLLVEEVEIIEDGLPLLDDGTVKGNIVDVLDEVDSSPGVLVVDKTELDRLKLVLDEDDRLLMVAVLISVN